VGAEMGGKQHLRGGQIGSGCGGGKQCGQQSGTLEPGGGKVYAAVGQLFSVANDEDGCGGLWFRGLGNLGVNRQGDEQQKEEKDGLVAGADSDECHVARIAPVCSVGMKLSSDLEAAEMCFTKRKAYLRG